MCSLQSLIKSFEVTELPGNKSVPLYCCILLHSMECPNSFATSIHWCAVRAAKFVARKQWIVCGSDDMYIRVYNYNTMDKVKTFEAHTDYIRCAGGGVLQARLGNKYLTCPARMLNINGPAVSQEYCCAPEPALHSVLLR